MTNSNFMSSAGKSRPIGWFYQGACPSDSPKQFRPIFGPIAGGRHEELKTRAPSNKHSKIPSLGDPPGGSLTPEKHARCRNPFPLPRLLRRQPCRQHPALARSLLLRSFPGQSGSSPAPTGSTLLGEIRDRTTLAGELLHSPKAGKSHALNLANVPDGCSLSWQGRTQSSLTPSLSKSAYNAEPIAGTG